MDVELVTRALIVVSALALAMALLLIGAGPRRHRAAGSRRRVHGGHARIDATNLMSYVAASMAATLGGALALTH